MTNYDKYKLKSMIKIILISGPVGLVVSIFMNNFELSTRLGMIGFFMGCGISLITAGTEFFIFEKYLSSRSFLYTTAARLIFYIISITTVYTTIVYLANITLIRSNKNMPIEEMIKIFYDKYYYYTVIISMIIILLMSFMIYFSTIVGKNLMTIFISGKYHTPVEEELIFMFVDMSSSTAIAEKLGNKQFHRLLNDFISHVSEPIILQKGTIYKYVGDEIIITWNTTEKNAVQNCINLNFEMLAAINTKQEYFKKKYGMVPEFKSAAHCGLAITGEMGLIKKEIAHLGDVVNTTARIESLCREVGKAFLISGTLYDRITNRAGHSIVKIGNMELKGKNERMDIYSVE